MLHFPVVLFDTAFWGGLLDWIRERPLAEGMISPEDVELLFVTDDPAEAVGSSSGTRSARRAAAAVPAKATRRSRLAAG